MTKFNFNGYVSPTIIEFQVAIVNFSLIKVLNALAARKSRFPPGIMGHASDTKRNVIAFLSGDAVI